MKAEVLQVSGLKMTREHGERHVTFMIIGRYGYAMKKGESGTEGKLSIVYGLKRWFRDLKLSKKMVIIYLVVAGMSCGISMLGLQASFGIYDRKLYEKSMQELEFFTQEVNDGLDEIENLSFTLAMDGDVQDNLRRASEMSYLSQEYNYTLVPVRKIFFNEINIHPAVKNAVYLDRRDVRMPVGVDCGTVNEETYEKLLSMCERARGGYVVLPPSEEFPYQISGRDILETKNASLDYLGTVLITSDISGVIEKKKAKLEYADSLLYVYSEDGVIYGSTTLIPKRPSMDSKQGYQIVQYNQERYFMSYLKDGNNGWMYVNYVPYREIFGQMQMLRYGMLGGLFLIFVITLCVMMKISHVVTNPLHHLTEAMHLVESGGFREARNFLCIEDRKDEAGILTLEFKVMLEKIESLIHENYEKQILIKDTRYQMLRAQINPHFMSNTLNAVNWMIKAGKNQDAARMVVELGNLMQAAVSSEPYVAAGREIAAAESYITIQRFRYKGRAEFIVDKQGNLEAYIIPCMILQPLIENAIHYGVEQTLSVCTIQVSAYEDEMGLTFLVSDDGMGMEEEELEMVRSGTMKPKGHGIGLNNIRERLRIAYADSEFIIDSEFGVGTQVTIRIPAAHKKTGES